VSPLRRDPPAEPRARGHGRDGGVVTAVVCTAFDAASDDAVYAVREWLRDAGVPLPPRPPHRPHFTLSAARVRRGAELERVCDVAATVAARHSPIPLVLSEVERFGRAGALWLGPGASPSLAALHRDVHRTLEDAGWPPAFGERSEPAAWVPHCTLATRVAKPRLRELQELVAARYEPIAATVDALAVILVGGRGDVQHLPLTGPSPREPSP
jgi:2'-5' RNA ligase